MVRTTRRDALATMFGGALVAQAAGVPALAEGTRGQGELVAYLTRSGNTRVFAGALARRRGARLFEIRTAEPYPEDYEAHVRLAAEQRRDGILPALAESVPGIRGYATVYLGFPIWGEAMPAPVRSFLASHDLAGRTVAPVITHGGFGPGSAMATLRELAPEAAILDPFVLECDQERRQLGQLDDWFASIEAGLPG